MTSSLLRLTSQTNSTVQKDLHSNRFGGTTFHSKASCSKCPTARWDTSHQTKVLFLKAYVVLEVDSKCTKGQCRPHEGTQRLHQRNLMSLCANHALHFQRRVSSLEHNSSCHKGGCRLWGTSQHTSKACVASEAFSLLTCIDQRSCTWSNAASLHAHSLLQMRNLAHATKDWHLPMGAKGIDTFPRCKSETHSAHCPFDNRQRPDIPTS